MSSRFALEEFRSVGNLRVWTTERVPEDGTVVLLADGKGLQFKILLDRFCLALPDEAADRELLFTEFFDWIANDYNNVVDCERNVQNIDNLCGLLARSGVGQTGHIVVDFGCGTGLSVRSGGCGQATIVGFDHSAMMRRIAEREGLTVWSEHDLSSQGPGSIHGAFASYTFHTRVGDEAIKLVVARLTSEGVFAANFHKSEGKEWAREVFASVGMHPVLEDADGRHGPYAVFGRSKRV